MAFQEVRLDPQITYGAVGGPKFNTTILTLSSGYEKRNINWSTVRAEYNIGYGIRTQAEMDAVRAFFYARAGQAYGFRMRDWADFKLVRQSIGLTDGTTTTYQIYKRYSSNSVNYDRNIVKIVADVDALDYTLSVWVNSVLVTEGSGDGQFQINRNTGIITIGATLAATSAETIEVQCEFDVPVRFNTDYLAVSIDDFNSQSWASIPVVEIRDIA